MAADNITNHDYHKNRFKCAALEAMSLAEIQELRTEIVFTGSCMTYRGVPYGEDDYPLILDYIAEKELEVINNKK